MVPVWRSEENMWDLLLSFHHVDTGIELRPPGSNHPCQLSHVPHPKHTLFLR